MKKHVSLGTVVSIVLLLALTILIPLACDHVSPKSKFVIAVPRDEVSYRRAAEHLEAFLEGGEFEITIVLTNTAPDAARLVANGKADLCLLMNKSIPIVEALGPEAAHLRTVVPLFKRAMFFYVPSDSPVAVISPAVSFKNAVIKVETGDGETMIGFQNMLDRAGVIKDYQFTTAEGRNSMFHLWDSYYTKAHQDLVASGWKSVSLDDNWIQFLCVNNAALVPVTIPAMPGDPSSRETKTVYSEALLLASSELGDHAIYKLSKFIHENKVHLLSMDRMFETIRENFDTSSLLFAPHGGADAYARRDDPSFLERYSDLVTLFALILGFAYATVQYIRNRMRMAKKNIIDKFFIEFLSIKSNLNAERSTQAGLYNKLFERVLSHMTEEKMESSDFHIMSRLIQNELVIIKS